MIKFKLIKLKLDAIRRHIEFKFFKFQNLKFKVTKLKNKLVMKLTKP